MQTFRTIFLTLFASWLALSANAQAFTQVDTLPDPFTSIRELYYELDTLQMPTGYLIDATWAMADVTPYKGNVIPPDSMAVDFGDYQSLYISTFGMSMTEATKNSFLTFRHMNAGMFARDTARLHGIALAYDRLDPAAVDDNLITIDTVAYRLYDVPGRSRSPYLPDTMVTLTIAGGRSDTLTQNFIFEEQDLLGQLSNASIFYLDAGQGFVKHDFGELFSLTFPSFDEYQLTLKLATTGGWKYAKIKLNLEQPQYKTEEETCDESVAFTGGDYCIKFSGKCGERLFRPLIIVNGFDPTGEGDLRLDRLNREFAFVFDGNHPNGGQTLKKVLLDDYGYDLIFVTFDNGVASNITTGDWLVNAIKSINARKLADGVTEKTPIIGVSMGGLVTKIAISKIEADNYDHQLSKYFSFDTPLRGANIPLGLQHAAAHVYRAKVLGVLIRKLDCGIRETGRALFNPAAKEMLLVTADAEATYRHWPFPSTVVHTTTTADHLAFQNYFDGLSINIPHYAISNGAAAGNQSVVGSGTSQISPNALILDIKSLPIPLNMRIKAKFLPQCFSVRAGGFQISSAALDLAFDGLPNYDLLAGGTRGTHDRGEKKNCKDKWPKKKSFSQEYVADYHSFIPTLSSLNLTLPGELPGSGTGSDYRFAGVEMLASRHNDVPYNVQNHSHVTVTPGIADFLVNNLIPVSDLSPTAIDPSTSILSYPYNFGQSSAGVGGPISTSTYLHGVLGVTSSGAILVNNDDVISNTTITSNPQNNTAPFQLTLTTGPCDSPPADITLQSGAEFIVGENQTRTAQVFALPETRVTVQSGGTLSVNTGSTFRLQSSGPDNNGGIVVQAGGLIDAKWGGRIIANGGLIRVKSGGMLRTSYNGQIIARNGGRIILEDGALVQLWGGDVDPEGNGQVWIQSGGTLEILGDYETSGNGYFHFSQGNEVEGPGALKIEHKNREYRRMYVDHGASVTLTGQDFYAQSARIIYDGSSGLKLRDGSEADVSTCVFEGGRASIQTDLTAKANIRHSDFRESKTGVEFLTEDVAGGSATVRSCTFTNCTEGVVAQHKGDATLSINSYPSIRSSEFINCEYGLYIQEHPSVSVYSSSFTSSNEEYVAIDATDAGLVDLVNCEVFGYTNDDSGAIRSDKVSDFRLDAGEYHNNSTVMTVYGTSDITLTECVEFSTNDIGIDCFAASTIDFNGSDWTNTSPAVQSANAAVTVTSTKSNSFVHGGDPFFQFESTGNIEMENNSWMLELDGNDLPIQSAWFDLSGSGNPSVTVTTLGEGCGSDCQNLDDCRRFCEYYPESDFCQIKPPLGGFKGEGDGPGLVLYPNPASGQVTNVNLPEDQSYSLTIYSATGQIVQTYTSLQSPVQEFGVSDLVSGFYLLQLSTESGDMQQKRFSIAR
jgi:hypothetical protein